MPQVCIVTDSSVQFTQNAYPGEELVTILPLPVHLNGRVYSAGRLPTLLDLPRSLPSHSQLLVHPPPPVLFGQILHTLARDYREILLITLSRHLHPTFDYAMKALESTRPSATVHLIDSRTTSVGLGYLVQAAASTARESLSAIEIKRYLLRLIPHIYAIFCLRSLTYLQNSAQLEISQAVVGELLRISPLYTLENGKPLPFYKARSSRNLVDTVYEFIAEINNLSQVAVLQGHPPFSPEARSLRERLQVELPSAICTEMSLGPVLGAILGPHTLGAIGIAGLS